MRSIALAPEVSGSLRIGVVEAAPVTVREGSPALAAEIGLQVGRVASAYVGKAPGEIEGLSAARRLYRAFGIDPTTTRPSSEALVRRILQGKPFPTINTAVDICNLCSVVFLLPIGLYDAAKIRGTIALRRGAPGEAYAGIRKDSVNVAGRPVLVDEVGPFGNPTSDSGRTSVDLETSSLLMVIFAPVDYPKGRMDEHTQFARDAMKRHLGITLSDA